VFVLACLFHMQSALSNVTLPLLVLFFFCIIICPSSGFGFHRVSVTTKMATPVASFLTRARCSSNSLMIRFNPWTLVHHRIVGFQCRQQQQQRQLCCLLVSSRPGEERNCREHRISAACPRSATIFRLPVNYRSNSQTRHWSSSSNSNSNSNDTSNYSYSEYENWVRRLYQTNKFHPVKLGLENIERLHDLLGRPMDQVRCFFFSWGGGVLYHRCWPILQFFFCGSLFC